MCKLFFSIKDFSGTTLPRILKFGTNIEYDLLYCQRENQHPHAYHIATDKRGYPHNIFLISQRKHMLWVLIRSGSARRF